MLHKRWHLSASGPGVYLDVFAFLQRRCIFLLLCWATAPVCGVSLKQRCSILKCMLNKYTFPTVLQNKMVCGWENGFPPQHMCSHFMAWGRVCGAQKSYCCCREVPVRCPLSSIPSFSHSGSGLGLCCSGSCLYCCCCLGILPLSEWIRTSGGKGLWDD